MVTDTFKLILFKVMQKTDKIRTDTLFQTDKKNWYKMKKTDNNKLIDFVFFLKKLITADFCKTVYPNKKKNLCPMKLECLRLKKK